MGETDVAKELTHPSLRRTRFGQEKKRKQARCISLSEGLVKDAPTVFAAEFSLHGECESFFEGEEKEEEHEEDERVRMAPNMGAGGSNPQATSNPEEKEKQHREGQLREEHCAGQELRK